MKIVSCNAALINDVKEPVQCQGEFFIQITKIAYLSQFDNQNKTGAPQIVQQPCWQCLACGAIKTQEEIFITEDQTKKFTIN